MEQMDYNLLFRWFVGLSMDSAVWDATTFSKNRDRLLDGEVARRFLAVVVEQARRRGLLSDDHFSVDGTLIEAWASIKSFRPKDGGDEPPGPGRNSERNFHGEKRSNETHASTTDPDARLYRKGNGQSSRMPWLLLMHAPASIQEHDDVRLRLLHPDQTRIRIPDRPSNTSDSECCKPNARDVDLAFLLHVLADL